MKQVQFATFGISASAEHNKAIRAGIEGPLNAGWELHSWNVVEKGVDVNNQPVVFIAVCLTRNLEEEKPAAKRGRPAKVDA